MRKLILDCDTGTDDAVAIILAAMSPELSLLGVTTVNGNVPVENTTDNSLRTLEFINSDVPVYAGLERPIARFAFPGESRVKRGGPGDVHGMHLDLPETTRTASDTSAVEYLIETYMASDGDITLVPVGPLSNIATAITLEPRIIEKIPEIVIMGGGFAVGNVTASAEFNIWADPEASSVVFNAGFKKLTLLPLDVTHTAGLISLAECDLLDALGTPGADAISRFVRKRVEGYAIFQPMDSIEMAPIHDALCIAYLIDESVVDITEMRTDIETYGKYTTGRTVMDPGNRSQMEPNSRVALTGNRDLFWEILYRTVS